MKSHNLKPGDFVRVSIPDDYYLHERDWGIKIGDVFLVVEDKKPDEGCFIRNVHNWVLLASPLGLHQLMSQNGHSNVVWLNTDWLEKVEDGDASLPDSVPSST